MGHPVTRNPHFYTSNVAFNVITIAPRSPKAAILHIIFCLPCAEVMDAQEYFHCLQSFFSICQQRLLKSQHHQISILISPSQAITKSPRTSPSIAATSVKEVLLAFCIKIRTGRYAYISLMDPYPHHHPHDCNYIQHTTWNKTKYNKVQ